MRAFAREQIGDFRHQREGGALGAVAAGLGALGHDDVRAGFQSRARVGDGLHLTDQHAAGGADRGREGCRIAEREHQGGGRVGKHLVQQMRLACQRPGDEAAADARIAGGYEFVIEPRRIAIAAADQPEPARRRDGGGEPAPRHAAHGREQDGVPDVEPFREARADQWISPERASASRSLAGVKPGSLQMSRMTFSRRLIRSMAAGSFFTASAGMTTAPW